MRRSSFYCDAHSLMPDDFHTTLADYLAAGVLGEPWSNRGPTTERFSPSWLPTGPLDRTGRR
jgi:hypothetical protein